MNCKNCGAESREVADLLQWCPNCGSLGFGYMGHGYDWEQPKQSLITSICPLCGCDSLIQREGTYRFGQPRIVPGGDIVVAGAAWQFCLSCGGEILPDELTKAIEAMVEERKKAIGV